MLTSNGKAADLPRCETRNLVVGTLPGETQDQLRKRPAREHSRRRSRIARLDLPRLDALPGCQDRLIQSISFLGEKTGNLNRRALKEVQPHRWRCGAEPRASVGKLNVFDVTQWESFPAKGRLENYIVFRDANRQRLPGKAHDRENNEKDPENAETRNKQG